MVNVTSSKRAVSDKRTSDEVCKNVESAQKFVEDAIADGLNVVTVLCVSGDTIMLDHPYMERLKRIVVEKGTELVVIGHGNGGGEWSYFCGNEQPLFGFAYGYSPNGVSVPWEWFDCMVDTYGARKKYHPQRDAGKAREEVEGTIDVVVFYNEDREMIVKIEDWRVKGVRKDLYVSPDCVGCYTEE